MNLEELVTQKEVLEKQLDEVNIAINKLNLTDVEWYKYAKKTHYSDLYQLPQKLHDYIQETTEYERYETIKLSRLIECSECITDEDPEFVKLLRDANFGSVEIDW